MIVHNAPMKKLALTLLLLAPIALTGCQTIKAHNPFRHKAPAYQAAQQEQPLEVPPGMTLPPSNDALTIPGAAANAGTSPAMTGAPPAVATGATGPTGSTSLALTDTPASAYHRVGLALARGDVGQVTAHDDAAMSYELAVASTVKVKSEGGFIHRLFHRSRTETVQGNVTVRVAPAGTGSVVEASGNADAAARVIAVLNQRLHGG